ncbi:PIN domain-containing protein [Pseudomonas sp.]|uniref:PIN domain-containing protein n=1 Tax=Pseudomonas sp. TaxID=306 RepID=UPI003A97376C
MINIVIDTSVYRTDPKRNKAAFRTLNKLISNKLIKVHIPTIIEKEFSTQQASQMESLISEGNKFISSLKKKTPEQIHTAISDIERNLINIYKTTKIEQENGLKNWAKKIEATIYPIDPEHGNLVLESYFNGSAPFSQPKERKDFPDAFIYESIKDIVKTQESLHFISEDNNLRSCCAMIPKVHTHSNLEDFLKSDTCIKATQQLENIANFKLFTNHINSYHDQLEKQLAGMLEAFLPYERFRDSHFKSDDNIGRIETLGELQGITFDNNNIERLAPDTILLPFSCELEALVYYSIHVSDYSSMTDNESDGIRIIENENSSDHYLEASEEVNILVSGMFSISMKFDPGDTIDDPDTYFSELLDFALFTIEEISAIEVVN